jgi:IclR family acetate operon transcriptional repressor
VPGPATPGAAPLGRIAGRAAEEAGSGTVQSFQRGLMILDLIITANRPLRLAEIARTIAIDKASAFRFLATLERFGLVAKDTQTKSYAVGGKLLHWSVTVSSGGGIMAVVRPHLERLVQETNESGHFAILSNERALLLDYIGSTGTIVVQNRVGVFEPLHCTALGKALLAFQPPERQEALLEGLTLKRYTPNTLVERGRLKQVLARVRADAVAVDDAEYNPVLFCVASPVLGGDGATIGAIGVSLVHPLAVREPRRITEVKHLVRRCAHELTRAFAGADIAAATFAGGSARRH